MYLGAWLWLLLSVLALARAADWGDWIIVDEAEAGTSVLLRRITPKSVFVAPTFGCSEGYRQDSLGRCVKHVKVNQAEQWKFYLERLNSMYAPASSKKPQKETGPFHISLPIGSETPKGDVVVKKRLPPAVTTTQSTTSTTSEATTTKTTTTTPPPTTTPTLVQETTTPATTQSTMVDPSETTTTERDLNSQTEITTEIRKKYETTEVEAAAMLGDQPVGTEKYSGAANPETPKNPIQASSQLPDKPFVIIVTNEPTTRAEETTFIPTSFTPPATEPEEEETSEASTTTEATTEGPTETTLKYTTDSNSRPTEYNERFSEVRDITEPSIRPNVRYTSTSTIRPKCDPEKDDYDSSDCEPEETEIISHKRVVTNPSAPAPSSLPLLEPNTNVRFPSESFVPPRKPQTFVRFPESTHPHDDRPALWWPSWQVRQHPGIRGWPPPEDAHGSSQQIIHKPFPSFPYHQPHPHPHPHKGQTWSDSNAWRRRFF